MLKTKLLIIPATFFLLGFMPYSGTVEDNAQIPFSAPILELQDVDDMNVEEMMDREFYRENYIRELPEADPHSKVPQELLDELTPVTEI